MLKEGIAKFLKLDQLIEHLTGFVEARIEIMKYDLKEDLSRVLAQVSVLLIMLMVGTFFLLFFSFAIAFELSKHLGDFWAFAAVSAFYVIVAVVIYASRQSLGTRIEKEIKEKIRQTKK